MNGKSKCRIEPAESIKSAGTPKRLFLICVTAFLLSACTSADHWSSWADVWNAWVPAACAVTKAPPAALPVDEEIVSVKIADKNGNTAAVCEDTEWIADLTEQIRKAESTTKATVQDAPGAEDAVRIDMICVDGSICSLFLYQEGTKYYIEQPYQGIYRTDADFYNKIHNMMP